MSTNNISVRITVFAAVEREGKGCGGLGCFFVDIVHADVFGALHESELFGFDSCMAVLDLAILAVAIVECSRSYQLKCCLVLFPRKRRSPL